MMICKETKLDLSQTSCREVRKTYSLIVIGHEGINTEQLLKALELFRKLTVQTSVTLEQSIKHIRLRPNYNELSALIRPYRIVKTKSNSRSYRWNLPILSRWLKVSYKARKLISKRYTIRIFVSMSERRFQKRKMFVQKLSKIC